MCLHCIQAFRIVKNKPLSLKIKFVMYVPVFFIFHKIKKYIIPLFQIKMSEDDELKPQLEISRHLKEFIQLLNKKTTILPSKHFMKLLPTLSFFLTSS